MDKTFDEAIAGIRKAERGVEVREDIAQGMEYVEQFANTAIAKAAAAVQAAAQALASKNAAASSQTAAANSASAAKSSADATAKSQAAAANSASAAKTSETNAGTSAASAQANAKKSEAARDDANTSKTAAADSAAAAKKDAQTASSAASTATGAASAAKTSETNAGTSASNAKGSETKSGEYLQATKEYFEQVRTITIGAQGWYATPEALKTAVPVGENGWWAVVGTTDTIWTWDGDTGAWVDTRKEVDLSDYLTQDQIRKLLERYMPLRPATATTLGGVKVGSGLKVTADGKLSADALAAYPVGSIYQSTNPTSPAALFGGTWEQIASDRVLMGASSSHKAGTTVNAGLPNITGSLTETKVGTSPFRGSKAGLSKSGALKFTEINTPWGGYNGMDGSAYNIEFDASSSNPIYGRSSTVQPAAYYVYIWHRVS